MSKEEILFSFPQGESDTYGKIPNTRIYEAMDKYAMQQSADFLKWAISRSVKIHYGYIQDDLYAYDSLNTYYLEYKKTNKSYAIVLFSNSIKLELLSVCIVCKKY